MAGLKNELSWSFSRHQALQACARRYYFKHYKSWGGWEQGCDPAVREIYRLSKLESRPTWQGSVVHRSIARSLQAARMGRPVPEPQAVIDEALGWMRQDYRDSRDDVARRSEDFKRHVRFVEHEYGEDDGSERWRSRWKESADLVAQALNAFFASSHWATLSALKESDWIELDDPAGKVFQSFEVAGVKVNVKIDAAFRENGRPILVDWKTGRRESPATPLQLAAYALYMQQRHGIAPGAIVAREVNLIVGTVKQHDVGPEALEIFHDIMTESVEKMRSLLVNVAENIPKPEGEFPFTQDERECRYCVFRGACPKISAAF